MERKINFKENQEVEIVISCSGDEWKKAQRKEFLKRQEKLEIKGFRKGCVPSNIAERYINKVEVLNDALVELVNKSYVEAYEENKLHIIAQPRLDVTKISEDEFEAVVKCALTPKIELGEYKGIKVEKKEVTVSDSEIDDYINNLRNRNATMNVKEGEAKLGDTVIIDFKGFIDDSPFDGGEAKNYELKLGSNSFVPGFEDQLVGIKAGESKSIFVTFPENYVENLKGKEARFDIKCSDVKETVLPEINDDFFAELNIESVKDIDSLKEYAKENVLKRKTREAENEHLITLINTIIDNSTVAISEMIVEEEAEYQVEANKKQVESNGLKFEDFLSINKQTMEQFVETKKVEARRNIKAMLVIEEICRVENISVNDELLNAKYEELAAQYSMTKEDVEKALGNNTEQFAKNLRNSLFNDFILKNND